MTTVMVTGGSGRLGHHVVRRLQADGAQVRLLSRRPRPPDAGAGVHWLRGDLRSGQGVHDAVRGADVVVHCASDVTHRGADVVAAHNVVNAVRDDGSAHLVFVSIVGVDRVPYRYYRDKLRAEEVIAASGLPWTILRATQFHQFVREVFGSLARWPVVPVPAATSCQPVDARDVADRLAELALGESRGRVPDLAGPEILTALDLAHDVLRSIGRRRRVVELHVPGATGGAFRAGHHLAPAAATPGRTWKQYLAESEPATSASTREL